MSGIFNNKMLIGGGVFLAGALAGYLMDEALMELFKNKWLFAAMTGFGALGAYIVIQRNVLTNVLPPTGV
jgi:hypothetical protein